MNTINLIVLFIFNSVLAGTPILFGTIGEITNEKVGHLNLGVEGMMALGACAGFMAGYASDNLFIAILAAFLAGTLASLIYAILTVTFMANQNVTGLSLTIFGVGLSNFIGQYMMVRSPSNTLKLPPTINAHVANLHIPFLSDIPIVGQLFFSYDIFVYLGIAVAIVMGIYINKTHAGRNMRSVGENPSAADAAGIDVVRTKYINLLLGGGICGIGGAYASLVSNGGVWLSNSVGGRGWIAVALVIFATWSPMKAILGSIIFGAFAQIKYYLPKTTFTIPNAFFDMLPYFVTALVLVITSIRATREKSQPAACGQNYFREER